MSNEVGTDVMTYRRLKRLQNCVDFGLTRVVPLYQKLWLDVLEVLLLQ